MTQYVFNYAEVDYKDRLLMTNILPLIMRREYTDIVFFWKCLYGNYDVDVNDFVSFFSDDGCSTRNSIDSGFLMVPPLCRTDCFNKMVPMWNSLPSNVRHITKYSSFISSLKHKHVMFEKMNTSFVSSDCCSWFFKCMCCNCQVSRIIS